MHLCSHAASHHRPVVLLLQCLRARRQRVGQGGGAYPAWNYTEFSVDYGSLSHHLCLGGVYVRLLLEGADQGEGQGRLWVPLLRLRLSHTCNACGLEWCCAHVS